jgi:hypothetical protein
MMNRVPPPWRGSGGSGGDGESGPVSSGSHYAAWPGGHATLAAAVAYAARGWAVLPIRGGNKAPLTPNGVKDATTEPSTIRTWWANWPDANVGIATGQASGLAVVDVDPRNGGDESLRDLEARHGPLPATVVCLTGGGGEHHYFTLPDGAPIRSRKIAPGL